jgi:DNA (cytosine-5)-methyltransferase 1
MKNINNMKKEHKYPYNWTLKDAIFTKDKGKVFSCFACGGGSTMGYKLAGFDVLGCNEIDPKMIEAYKTNHKPKYAYLEPIQTFKTRKDLPEELYNLDILDGSPPCSSFSMAGNREKDWGVEKKFKEGQAEQILDTLFFDFIDLAKELKPKVVVAENVKGLLLGNAKDYVKRIYKAFDEAGYYCQHFLLDASKMGVPQKRERVFFICLRKDLGNQFLHLIDMFTEIPKIEMEFNEREIAFKEFDSGKLGKDLYPSIFKHWEYVKEGESVCNYLRRLGHKEKFFSYRKVNPNQSLRTILSDTDSGEFRHDSPHYIHDDDFKLGGSYPTDYNFLKLKPKYLIGMSVPPVMTAQIASKIYEQWLSKL